MLSQNRGSVAIVPPIGFVAKEIARSAVASIPFPLGEIPRKAISAIQVGDIEIDDTTFQNVVSAWMGVLGSANSIFFGGLARGLFMSVPLFSAIGVATGSMSATQPGEMWPMILQRITFDRAHLVPRTTTAVTVVSQELVEQGGPQAQVIIGDAVQLATREDVDRTVADGITDSSSAGQVASGTTANALLRDATAAMKAVFAGGQATTRGFWAMSPAVAIALTCLASEDGAPICPDMRPDGGTLLGFPALVGSGWSAGCLSLIDGGQVAAGGDVIGLSASRAGAYSAALSPTQRGDTGQGESSGMVSAFQTQTVEIKSLSRFTWAVSRPEAIYTVSGADLYETAAS
jgi:hypothetical protein